MHTIPSMTSIFVCRRGGGVGITLALSFGGVLPCVLRIYKNLHNFLNKITHPLSTKIKI